MASEVLAVHYVFGLLEAMSFSQGAFRSGICWPAPLYAVHTI